MDDKPSIAISPTFLLPFAVAAICYTLLDNAQAMHGIAAAVTASITALLVGCALCIREEEGAVFSIAAGLWSVAGAFFAMPFLMFDHRALFGAWIAAADISFAASIATNRLTKEFGFGKVGQIATTAISAHGVLLAIVYVYGGTWGVPLYMLFVAAHAYSIQKRLMLQR